MTIVNRTTNLEAYSNCLTPVAPLGLFGVFVAVFYTPFAPLVLSKAGTKIAFY